MIAMEILSPLTRADEVDPLVDAGATEFYAGVLTPEWRRTYTTLVSGNQQHTTWGNFLSLRDLSDAVERAHERNVTVHLTVNTAYYTQAQHELVGKVLDAGADMGIDGFIIADMPTMLRARQEHPDTTVHVSTLAPCFNRSTLAFYADLGASRIVLPQQLTPDEITALAQDAPLDIEVFVLNNRCLNIDGFCTFTHGVEEATGAHDTGLGHALLHSRWALTAARLLPRAVLQQVRRCSMFRSPPCMLQYTTEPLSVRGAPLDGLAAARERMSSHFKGKTGIDCGACVLRTLLRAGVRAVKIDGRTNDLTRKLMDVRFLANLLEVAGDDTITDEELYARTRSAFRERYAGTCTDISCYYRKFLPTSYGDGRRPVIR